MIQLRRRGEPGDVDRDAIAATCLRACGLGTAGIAEARREAQELLATVPAP